MEVHISSRPSLASYGAVSHCGDEAPTEERVRTASLLSRDKEDIAQTEHEGMIKGGTDITTINRRDRILLSFWHTMGGCMALMAWSIVLNCSLSFQEVIWPGHLFSDLLIGCHQAGALTSLVILTVLDRFTLNVLLARILNVVVVISFLAFPLPVFFLEGNDNVVPAKLALCFLSVCLGIGGGIYQAQCFAFAAIIPRRTDQAILISAGNGIGGVVSWVSYTLCYEVIFDKTSLKGQQLLVVVLVVVSLVCVVVNVIVQEFCFRMPILIEKLKETQNIKRLENERYTAAVAEGRKEDIVYDKTEVWPTIRRSFSASAKAAYILVVTLFIFPASGPFNWPMSSSLININIGVFQLGDFAFRLIPVLGPWAMTSEAVTDAITFGRTILIAFFILPVYLPSAPFIASPTWLTFCTFILVLTNGWTGTVAIVRAMNTARNKKESETVANFMTLLIVAFGMVAAFGSKLPLLGL